MREEQGRKLFHSKAFMPSFGLDEIQFGKLQAQLAEMPRDKQEEMTTEMIAIDEERQERLRKMAEKRQRQQETSTSVSKKKSSGRSVDESPAKGRAASLRKNQRSPAKHKKDVSRQLGKGNPLDLNEGDAELQPYFDPLVAVAGGNLQELLNTKASPNDDTVQVTGVRLWAALNNT